MRKEPDILSYSMTKFENLCFLFWDSSILKNANDMSTRHVLPPVYKYKQFLDYLAECLRALDPDMCKWYVHHVHTLSIFKHDYF